MMRKVLIAEGVLWLVVMILTWTGVVGCGGTRQVSGPDQPAQPVGTSHVDDLELVDAGATPAANTDAAVTDAGTTVATPVGSGVVFEFVNTHDEDLVLNLTKGWTRVISAWSGKRGVDAKAMWLFEQHCTASCSAAEVCPKCEAEFKSAAAERAAQKKQVIAPGQSFRVTWDGKALNYRKPAGRHPRKCQCWDKADAQPNTYTVRAYGYRLTKKAGRTSKVQWVDQSMTLPDDGGKVIRFEFGAPTKR